MTTAATNVPQATAARLAGAMFLFVNAAGIFAEVFVRGSLLTGDATHAAQNVMDAERLYRLSILSDIVMLAGGLVLIWSLYLLLRPVSRDLALLAVFLRLVETAVSVVGTIASLLALRLLGGAAYLSVFETGELHALSRLARTGFGFSQDVGFVFLGLGSTVFAYLLLTSRYVPRLLAGWGVFASLLLTTYNLMILVFPETVEALMYVALAPMGLYEIPLGVWLVIRGAKIPAGVAAPA